MDDADVPEAVAAYLDRIGRVRLLDPAEERELARQVRAGRRAAAALEVAVAGERAALAEEVVRGREARDRLAAANLRLVVAQARHLASAGVPLLDLVQEGNLGLLEAVDRFDPDLGFRFSTYAHDWIAQAIWAALATDRLVRLPPRAGARLAHCRRVRAELHGRDRREPGPAEVAAATGYSQEQVEALMRSDAVPFLESDVDADDVAQDAVGDDDPTERAHRREVVEQVWRALRRLAADEREVLELRYGLEGESCTIVETARRLGVGVHRVRSLERRALRSMREHAARDGLTGLAGVLPPRPGVA